MKKINVLILILIVTVLLSACGGKVSDSEKERIYNELIQDELIGEYVERLYILESSDKFDKELGVYTFNVFIDANESFYNLTDEQKHFLLKETSNLISNNIPLDIKIKNSHIKCSGKKPCRFLELSYSYKDGSITDKDAINETYSIDFNTNVTVMQIYRMNEDFNNKFEDITGIEGLD